MTPYTVAYDGNPHTATGTAKGVKGEDLSADLDLSKTTHTNAGDYPNDPWTFHDPNGNYKDTSGTVADAISQANATITVTPYTVPYDGNPHTATGTAKGAKGEDLSADLDLSQTTHTNVGDYPNDPWTFHDPNGNYQDASGTVHDQINSGGATITVTPYTVTYDGNPHTATGTAKCGNSDLSADLDLSKTTHTNAGDYPNDPWTFHDPNGNCKDANGTVHDAINQASATITVTPYIVTYDGNPHTATGTATGVQGEDLSADLDLSKTTHTNAGDYPNDPWTFHDPTGNYKDASGTVHDIINKANATVTVTPYDVAYDGNPHTATGTAKGVKGEDLSADLDLSKTTHTNAGDYPNDPWTFHDPNGNYKDANGTVHDIINQANATITVTPYTVPYDGNPHTATGTAKGIKGEDLSADLDLSKTTHTNAGDYPNDPWTFHDPNGNYQDASGTVHDQINSGGATITVTPYTVTYDGNPHTATGTAKCGNSDLSADLDLSKTTHTNTGDYPNDPWTFHDPNGNCKDANGTVHDAINQTSATINVTPYIVTYDGNPHTATGTAKGVKGEDLSADLDLSKTTHTNAGDYPNDPWTFHDPNGNYKDANGTVHDAINQASATITVTPYTVTYDGNPHTATGTATGAKGEDLSADLDLSKTTHTNAGDYPTDPWTFHDPTGNYKDAAGTVHDVINQANATINVTPYTLTYDGNPHTATGTAKCGNSDLSVDLDLSKTIHTNAGDYPNDPWAFRDPNGNCKDASGTVHDAISQANATINVTPYTVTYDGNPHTATGTAKGVKGEDLSPGLDLSKTIHTNASDYPMDPWSFHDPNGNYKDASGTVHDVIKQATTMIAPFTSAPNSSVVNQPVTIKATVTGANGGTPTGTVAFADNGTVITTGSGQDCSAVKLAPQQTGSAAQCVTTTLSLGKHANITAAYKGDGNFTGSNATLAPAQDVTISTTMTAFSPTLPSVVNQSVTFTATVTAEFPGGTLPTGTVAFLANGATISGCGTVMLNQSNGQAQCKTATLPVGSDAILAMYTSGDGNFSGSSGSATQEVNRASTTTAAMPSSLNPAVSGQAVTFTVTVSPQYPGATSPTGTVAFFVNSATVPGCAAATLSSGQAQCVTNMLPSGLNLPITATYSGDSNFVTSTSPALLQTVEDFSPSVAATPGVTLNLVSVPQTYTNTNQPFDPQTITFSAASLYGFGNSLALTCQVNQISGQSPTCSFSGNPIPFANDPACTSNSACTTITIGAAGSQPVGIYTVTITATDTVTGLTHTVPFPVAVVNNTLPIIVAPGVQNTTLVSFVSTADPKTPVHVNFSCQSVTGGTGVTCGTFNPVFSPSSADVSTTPTSVTLTISGGSTSARLWTGSRVLAALWLGMPAVVIIGSLRFGKPSRKKFLQLLGMLLLLIALLQGIGCGGGFTPPPPSKIPAGSYKMLVVGADSTGVQTSAVIPINVNP